MEIEVTDDIRVAPESKNMIRILSEAFEKRTTIDINGKQYMVVAKSHSVFSLRRVESVKAAEWTGEGLPPDGTVCEWCPNQDGWVQIQILGHDGEETWFRRAGESISETCLRMAFFRPIRTPEQIAAEEREAGIEKLLDWVADQTKVDRAEVYRKNWAVLYDAGLRPPVNP